MQVHGLPGIFKAHRHNYTKLAYSLVDLKKGPAHFKMGWPAMALKVMPNSLNGPRPVLSVSGLIHLQRVAHF